jgi:hypothetical protein
MRVRKLVVVTKQIFRNDKYFIVFDFFCVSYVYIV